MASRPSLRQSLGFPTRVEPPPIGHGQKKHSRGAGLAMGGGGRPSTSHGAGAAAAAQSRRKTQVLSKGSRPSTVAVGQGR